MKRVIWLPIAVLAAVALSACEDTYGYGNGYDAYGNGGYYGPGYGSSYYDGRYRDRDGDYVYHRDRRDRDDDDGY